VDLSRQAYEVLGLFGAAHRRPGARLTLDTLRKRIGTEPAVVEAVRELVHAGYVIAPDSETVELTPKGYDAVQRDAPGEPGGR
jgi:hypothetical protein